MASEDSTMDSSISGGFDFEVCEYYLESITSGQCWKKELCKKLHPMLHSESEEEDQDAVDHASTANADANSILSELGYRMSKSGELIDITLVDYEMNGVVNGQTALETGARDSDSDESNTNTLVGPGQELEPKPKMIDVLNEKKISLFPNLDGFYAQVSCVNGIDDFYIIPLKFGREDFQGGNAQRNLLKLTAMENELKSFMKSHEQGRTMSPLVPGDIVGVRDPKYLAKYKRGVVLEFPNQDSFVKVQLLDVGNIIMAPILSAVKLPEEFTEMQPMAYRCKLKLLSGLMSLEASDLFKGFEGEVFYVHVCPGPQPKFGNGFAEEIPYDIELWTHKIINTKPSYFMVSLTLCQAAGHEAETIVNAQITNLVHSSNIFTTHRFLAQ